MFFFYLQVFLLQIFLVQCQLNNACDNYQSYLNIFSSPNCYHIPDNGNDANEIIERHVGISETHRVVTDDGYILTLFRIPRKESRGSILFQHGMTQDSRVWVAQYNESIAFLFWQAGYDVWLGNSRGSHYSKNHVELTPEDHEFWNFSFHEIGYYDLNSTIEYIKNVTNESRIFYVGHSMGATSGVVYASMRPDEAASSVKLMVLLAPVCYCQYANSPLAWFFGLADFLLKNNFHKILKWYSFPSYDSIILAGLRILNIFFPFKFLYVWFMSFSGGWSPHEFDPNYVNLMVDQTGSETSLKSYAHYYQITGLNKQFRMFDFGKNNLEVYGNEEPPVYPLENIKTPIFSIYGVKDLVTHAEDIELMYERLPLEVKVDDKIELDDFNHVDFFWGRHRNEFVYYRILKILNKY